ncbi:head GIN domain-containing protein [Aureitalea marina]|uniref:DUF2807 domain-containing protein n=1 Tax=Aureitalea marina TaxID=930804 RepID=A0A2S7KLY5_9FLAO|nr:head GIN domain-containing protein [Aureitalea marina]PQB03649.1 DUF2807 domain-containing protein [Aureitalea marina]
MKYLLAILICFTFLGCNSEDGWDCLQTEGNSISVDFTVDSFDKIRIEDGVSLLIRQGAVQSVTVETGTNLLSDIEVYVEENTLVIRDNNRCNLVRDYGVTRAVVTTPDLLEIRNASAFDVRGEGRLSFPKLDLISNTTGNLADPLKSGDFYLDLDTERLLVNANGQSVFYLTGRVQQARYRFTDEFPRLEAGQLIVSEVIVFQRSANVMIVNPQQSLTGEIYGTGDVISLNRPAVVEVETFFTGRLIFSD